MLIVVLIIWLALSSSAVPPLRCECLKVSQPEYCVHLSRQFVLAQRIRCAIESGEWFIPMNSTSIQQVGCLLGKKRCEQTIDVPSETSVSPSPPPPPAKNRRYQELATTAESVVPQTWWRKGFADDRFLLTSTNSDFPRRMFESKSLSNKKLRNIYECVTRQQFIRKSLDMSQGNRNSSRYSGQCQAMSDPSINRFLEVWTKSRSSLENAIFEATRAPKRPSALSETENLVMAAQDVLEYFYRNHGGIWTGCFALEGSPDCRGALAAASFVTAVHQLGDIAGRRRSFRESQFVRGYILSSLGRHLLHGDSSNVGSSAATVWRVRCWDFILLQQSYLQLYTDSFGKLYNNQLAHHLPLAFHPNFTVQAKQRWRNFSDRLEPVYTSVRNWMYTESFNLIDFGPYIPLVAFPDVRRTLEEEERQELSKGRKRRRVLVDVGANGFFASPKYLLDSYAPFLPFTDAIMVEPEPHFSATVPKVYSDTYNITHLAIYAEVATGSSTDMLRLLPSLVEPEDFVVLKFDVDPNRFAQGPTMEWGFLFELMRQPQVASLVDEVYIELHFHFPLLYWKHFHSNWEAVDTFRYLRQHGAVVHSWP